MRRLKLYHRGVLLAWKPLRQSIETSRRELLVVLAA
jgi:hypothetical protein